MLLTRAAGQLEDKGYICVVQLSEEAPDSQQKNISFNNAPTGLDALVDHLFFIRDGVKASINILLS